MENLILLCGSGTTGCHGWVHSHPTEAYEQGFLVYSYQEPSEVPVRTYRGWRRLLQDGTCEACHEASYGVVYSPDEMYDTQPAQAQLAAGQTQTAPAAEPEESVPAELSHRIGEALQAYHTVPQADTTVDMESEVENE